MGLRRAVFDSQDMSKQFLEDNYVKADNAVKPVFRESMQGLLMEEPFCSNSDEGGLTK